MKHNIKISAITLALLFLNSFTSMAQPEMADGLRSEGKIYVVVAIIVIILIGVFVYLFALDRKLTKLENRFRDRTQN